MKLSKSLIAISLLAMTTACASNQAKPPKEPTPSFISAQKLIENPEIPAAGVIILSCETLDISSAGHPSLDTTISLSEEPMFNIGSNAKSMLATTIAALNEKEMLNWDLTIAQSGAFSQVRNDHPFADVTLAMLLSHTSGIAQYESGSDLNTVKTSGTPAQQRRQFAELGLNSPAAGEQGKYAYSNAGIVIAGVMVEHVIGKDIFDIMEEELFQPLKIDATIGTPSRNHDHQPIGHYATADQKITAYKENEPAIPLFLQSAGYVSLSAKDYAKYIQVNLCGMQQKETKYLMSKSWQKLHTPFGSSPYALGWARLELGGYPTSFHIGSTGTFYAFAAIQADANKAAAIMINSGTGDARNAAITELRSLLDIKDEE